MVKTEQLSQNNGTQNLDFKKYCTIPSSDRWAKIFGRAPIINVSGCWVLLKPWWHSQISKKLATHRKGASEDGNG
jgi:hypothetical protein